MSPNLGGPDIRRPGAVDADWLTRVLQAGGVDAVVASFEAANVGSGQIGESVRFKLRYCLLYTSPSPRDRQKSRMPSSA